MVSLQKWIDSNKIMSNFISLKTDIAVEVRMLILILLSCYFSYFTLHVFIKTL